MGVTIERDGTIVIDDPEIEATLSRLAERRNVSEAEVLRIALTNALAAEGVTEGE